jgi:hypothetical protein
MSPDAGGTDQVTQNRGYVAISEVGDQVMVNFVHNHPDRPFVMGGMFHGGVGLGGFADNRVKSIMTRSGHKVVFTEDESIIIIIIIIIIITDKSGNEIHLDTTGSNINITAPETMTLNCKNMNINVTESMNTNVGMNQNNTVGMNISESAGMNRTSTVGLLNMLSVGTDFITNVTGKMTEFITGNKESHTEKDRLRVANGKITNQKSGSF